MKNPLHYQLTEYDCGPTSLLNAVNYLFEREEIPPEIVRNIMLYCLDCYGADGVSGKSGTSGMAMMFLSNWLNGYGHAGHLPIRCRYITGEAVHLGQNGALRDALQRGGAAVVLVDFEGWHYVLLTQIQCDSVYLFDPYYREQPFEDGQIGMDAEHPKQYNRIVPVSALEKECWEPYAMGPAAAREAVLVFNERTMLTAERTVEYVI